MPRSWTTALNRYSYPVRLSDYKRAGEFPGFFTREISGDPTSTIEFEDYFRANYDRKVEPYFEVVFWKLYKFPLVRQGTTSRIADSVSEEAVEARELCCAVDLFVEKPSRANAAVMRALLGLKTAVLATVLTFPAFVDPTRYPMIDRRTASWVDSNCASQSRNRATRLRPFNLGMGVVGDSHFDSYVSWVDWCRETAEILTARRGMPWRARDVEMAVFTAARERLSLNPLPQ
jgi:hypothetical protein